MGSERGRVTSHPEDTELVHGQVAAAWFTNNRNRLICLISLEGNKYMYVANLTPKQREPTLCSLTPSPEPNLTSAIQFVLLFLLEE